MSKEYQAPAAAHPITPPPELVQQWVTETWHEGTTVLVAASDAHIATQAARWGADEQLEECVAWLEGYERDGGVAEQMRNDFRPKPPSLKTRALQAWAAVEAGTDDQAAMAVIRRALEALPE